MDRLEQAIAGVDAKLADIKDRISRLEAKLGGEDRYEINRNPTEWDRFMGYFCGCRAGAPRWADEIGNVLANEWFAPLEDKAVFDAVAKEIQDDVMRSVYENSSWRHTGGLSTYDIRIAVARVIVHRILAKEAAQ
jgi:hypothetical protein